MPKESRKKAPSRAVANGATTGTLLGTLVLWGLQSAGVPLPDDPTTAAMVGGAIGNLLGQAVSFITKGGRKGEAD